MEIIAKVEGKVEDCIDYIAIAIKPVENAIKAG
jgi:hypothetical protein